MEVEVKGRAPKFFYDRDRKVMPGKPSDSLLFQLSIENAFFVCRSLKIINLSLNIVALFFFRKVENKKSNLFLHLQLFVLNP